MNEQVFLTTVVIIACVAVALIFSLCGCADFRFPDDATLAKHKQESEKFYAYRSDVTLTRDQLP